MTALYILVGRHVVRCDDVDEWGAWYASADRLVASTELADGIAVVTTFLGITHTFRGALPVVFETTVVGGTLDGWTFRSATWTQAEEVHRWTCDRARIALGVAPTVRPVASETAAP